MSIGFRTAARVCFVVRSLAQADSELARALGRASRRLKRRVGARAQNFLTMARQQTHMPALRRGGVCCGQSPADKAASPSEKEGAAPK